MKYFSCHTWIGLWRSFVASGVGQSLLNSGQFRLIVEAPDDRRGWLWSNWRNGEFRENLPQCHLAHHIYNFNVGWNPGHRCRNLVTKRLSYGAALISTLLCVFFKRQCHRNKIPIYGQYIRRIFSFVESCCQEKSVMTPQAIENSACIRLYKKSNQWYISKYL